MKHDQSFQQQANKRPSVSTQPVGHAPLLHRLIRKRFSYISTLKSAISTLSDTPPSQPTCTPPTMWQLRALSSRFQLIPRRLFTSATTDNLSATSLQDIARFGARVVSLDLRTSNDLICRQLLCEHVGDACACRLALALERVPRLRRLDLSNNRLRALPEAVYALQHLEWLDVRQNCLSTLSTDLAKLTQLQTLDVRSNKLKTLPIEQLETLEKLETICVTGNVDLIRTFESLEMSERLRATFVLE